MSYIHTQKQVEEGSRIGRCGKVFSGVLMGRKGDQVSSQGAQARIMVISSYGTFWPTCSADLCLSH